MTAFRVRPAELSDSLKWDSYVLAKDDAGPYHLYAWKQAIEKAYGHRSLYLMAEDEKQNVKGILPLFLIKPPLIKGDLVSLPFCDYGGALASDAESLDALHRSACGFAHDLHARLELRLREPEPSLTNAYRMGSQSHKARMLLDLPSSSEELWGSFKSKLRSQIKRPQKDGLDFVLGASELVNDFYSVFSVNMHDLGSPVHSRELIDAVVRSYGQRAHVGIVRSGDKPVAGGVILEINDLVAIPWASALNEYSRSSPNMLLYWGFLAYAADHGFKRFDFGRSTPGEGTFRFKEQWGARPCALHWYTNDSKNSMGKNNTPGHIRTLAEKAWSRLPLVVADTLGPLVRRYITL